VIIGSSQAGVDVGVNIMLTNTNTSSATGLARSLSSHWLSMTLQKHTRPVDGTIPVTALLYSDEENYASQDGVGIYDG
jgi:hypothetical protein